MNGCRLFAGRAALSVSDASGERFAAPDLVTSNVADLVRNSDVVFIAAAGLPERASDEGDSLPSG